jgi:phosphate transport system permease protein
MTAAPPTVTTGAVRRSLTGHGPDWPSLLFQGILAFSLLFSLLVLVILLLDILSRGLPVLVQRGPSFLTASLSSSPALAGVAQGLWGSFALAIMVALLAFPLGVATAVYLEEYASESLLTRMININIRNLAGVPSIVYGLLGLAIFVGAFKALGVGNGRNVLAGGLTMSVLVLPIVIITASEALRAVPGTLREAGYGVGASRWEVTSRLVLPAAVPGILTGIVLSLSRALGETAPLILAGAVLGSFSSGNADVLGQLVGPYTALPMVVFNWTRQPQQDFHQLAAAGIIVLLAVTLAANALAIYLRNRYGRTW